MVCGASWTRDKLHFSNKFSICMIAAWCNLFPFGASVLHILKNESYASARCNIHLNVRSSVGPVRGCDSIRVRKDVSSRDNNGRKFQREATLCCLVVSSSNTGSIKACMWTAMTIMQLVVDTKSMVQKQIYPLPQRTANSDGQLLDKNCSFKWNNNTFELWATEVLQQNSTHAAETNSGRSDGIKINVHTEELNKCLIPDNETATAEGKDQLQLRVQQEVDWFTTSNCHLFSATEEFIESLRTNKE